MVKIGPFLTKITKNRLDNKKRKLPLIEMKITDQLVNKNINFVNNGLMDQRVSAHHCIRP